MTKAIFVCSCPELKTAYIYDSTADTYIVTQDNKALYEDENPLHAWHRFCSTNDRIIIERIRDMWYRQGLNRWTGQPVTEAEREAYEASVEYLSRLESDTETEDIL